MAWQLALLWSDWAVYGLLVIIIGLVLVIRRKPHLRAAWRTVFQRRLGMVAFIILLFYSGIGLLDSIHIEIHHQPRISILDVLLSPLGQQNEKTYSAPFATHLYTQSVIKQANGRETRGYALLQHVDASHRIIIVMLQGLLFGFLGLFVLLGLWTALLARKHASSYLDYLKRLRRGGTTVAWREAMMTVSVLWLLVFMVIPLAQNYHILGTGKIGNDIFFEAIKSIRTGILIGTLTTVFMLPFALVLGTLAGYFRGWVDDIIQYLYTTLSSIPGVLLISAAVLVMQVYMNNHPELFPSLLQRADARLLALCFILGITTWASLCRLLRAETLKLRGREFVQAAKTLGVWPGRVITRHIVPNVLHIVLITLVLDFSGLVLAEAVLSYVGVGVDPTTFSWGNMINSARLELAREPMVWWPLLSALGFMFVLVLSANLFADSVRDAFDPRLREAIYELKHG